MYREISLYILHESGLHPHTLLGRSAPPTADGVTQRSRMSLLLMSQR